MTMAHKAKKTFNDAAPLSDDGLAFVEHMAGETVYFISHVQCAVDICALALNHATSHDGRVVGQVMGVLDLLSEVIEGRLDRELTTLEMSVGKVRRAVEAAGDLADIDVISAPDKTIYKKPGGDA